MNRFALWMRALHRRFVAGPQYRFLFTLLVPVLLVLAGTLGYRLIERDFTLFDALYMTVITLSTIGYGEIPYPLSPAGRLFTIVLILSGVFTFFYAATAIIRSIVSGELRDFVGKQQMERSLMLLQNHMVVCGYGRMGRLVCQEFSRQQLPFVVIDADEPTLKSFEMPHGIALAGDATSDDVLKRAGIERARALIAVMPSDADNLYTTMSARLLNPKLFIVARVEEPQSEQKLRRAGANRVVSPYVIGGSRIAHAVLRPTVVDFIELATQIEHIELQIEETEIAPGSPLVGANVKDSGIRPDLKLILVAIKKSDGRMVFNPTPETVLEAADILVAIGHREQLDRLEILAHQSTARA